MGGKFGKKFEVVCDILDRHEHHPDNLIAILQEIQEVYSYLPEDIMTYVATALQISPGSVFGVATFYSHFALEPKCKYIVKVCDGTACHVKRSEEIIKMLQEELNIGTGKDSSDPLFTLETVACLGACGLAPVIVINEDVHGSMNPEKTKALIEKIRSEETAHG